jgi:metal-responsive CopG/Arc/MetJ family transcriptional regulator
MDMKPGGKTNKGLAGAASRKVIVQFPESLLERAEALAESLHTDRSKLIRAAVEEKLDQLERERLEAELREGYLANAELLVNTNAAFQELATELLNQDEQES